MAAIRQAFLVPSGPAGNHLFFVISGPSVLDGYGSSPHVITACICTLDVDIPHDAACILQPGDHPFIQHPSYVSYRHMRVDPVAHVDQMLVKNLWQAHIDCAATLHQRITAGVCASRLSPREFKRLFNCP